MATDPFESIALLKTVEDCESFERNANRLGRSDLVLAARKRALAVRAGDLGPNDEVERQCLEAIYAYERVLSEKNKKKTLASRTWPMVKRYGIIGAVERAVCRKSETAGYTALVEMGLENFAFESVILRFPDRFSAEAVAISSARIKPGP